MHTANINILQRRTSNDRVRIKIGDLQRRVYRAARRIPRGCVTTYKLLADHVGCAFYPAVGQALKRNPFAPDVPCHRVIASDLSIGGFCGKRAGDEIKRKLDLLAKENVFFENGKLADARKIYRFKPEA